MARSKKKTSGIVLKTHNKATILQLGTCSVTIINKDKQKA